MEKCSVRARRSDAGVELLAGVVERAGSGRGGAEKGGGACKKKDGRGDAGELGRRRGAGAIGRLRGAALGIG